MYGWRLANTNEVAFIKHNKKEQLKMHQYIIPLRKCKSVN